MAWSKLLLALIRCELKARYNGLGGWQLTAKGALPIVLLAIAIMFVGGR